MKMRHFEVIDRYLQILRPTSLVELPSGGIAHRFNFQAKGLTHEGELRVWTPSLGSVWLDVAGPNMGLHRMYSHIVFRDLPFIVRLNENNTVYWFVREVGTLGTIHGSAKTAPSYTDWPTSLEYLSNY